MHPTKSAKKIKPNIMRKLKQGFWNYRFEIILCFIIIFGSVLVLPLFEDGFSCSWDGPSHLLKSKFMTYTLFPNLKIDGWFPYNFLGYQAFLFYSQLFYIFVSLLHYSSLGLISVETSMKILMALSYTLLPVTMYALLRGFKLDKTVAIFAAFFSLTVSTIYGNGLESIFVIGLIPNAFAIMLLPLALLLFHKALTDRFRFVLFYILTAAIITYGHFLTAVYLFLSTLIYLLCFIIYHKKFKFCIKRFLLIVSLIFLISLFKIYPIIAYYNIMGISAHFAPINFQDFIVNFIKGEIISNSIINILSIIGIFVCIRKNKHEYTFICLLTFTTLILSFGLITTGIKFFDNILFYFKPRALSFLSLLISILAAVSITEVIKILENLLSRPLKRNMKCLNYPAFKRFFGFLVFSFVFFMIFSLSVYGVKELALRTVRVEAHYKQSYAYQQYNEAFEWIENNANDLSFITEEGGLRNYSYPGFSNIDNVINLKTDKFTLGGHPLESSPASKNVFFTEHFHEYDPNEIYEKMLRWNVKYILTWNKDVFNNFKKSKNFEIVFQNDLITIWEVLGQRGIFAVSSKNITFYTFNFTYERLEYILDNEEQNNEIVFAVSYNPKWHAFVNDEEITIKRTYDDLMSINLRDEGYKKIVLEFKQTPLENIIGKISLFSFIIVLCLLLTPSRIIKLIKDDYR